MTDLATKKSGGTITLLHMARWPPQQIPPLNFLDKNRKQNEAENCIFSSPKNETDFSKRRKNERSLAQQLYSKEEFLKLFALFVSLEYSPTLFLIHNISTGWVKNCNIMKGKIKDRHNPLIYFKSILCKRLFF